MKTTVEVLQRAQDMLRAAQLGAAAVNSPNPDVRYAGVRNAIVFGRAVTNVLQSLKSIEPGFDGWYGPIVKDMSANPMMKYLYKVRSEILKEGSLPVSSSIRVNGNVTALMEQFERPPGARSFFMADRLGGAGWEVETASGEIEVFYVDLPDDFPHCTAVTEMIFSEGPIEVVGKSGVEVCTLYLQYLEGIIKSARTHFLKIWHGKPD